MTRIEATGAQLGDVVIRGQPEQLTELIGPSSHQSGSAFTAGSIGPRDIIAPLPEHVVDWLHVSLDRASGHRYPRQRARLLEFESAIVERLFPRQDSRGYVRRLQRHCRVTAEAARTVAWTVGLPPDTLQICGFLHDLGVASAIRHADEVGVGAESSDFGQLWPILQRSAGQHAVWLATRWHLPSSVRYTIREHVEFDMLTNPSAFVSATVVGEYVAGLVGYGFGSSILTEQASCRLHRALQQLHMRATAIPELARRITLRMSRGGPPD